MGDFFWWLLPALLLLGGLAGYLIGRGGALREVAKPSEGQVFAARVDGKRSGLVLSASGSLEGSKAAGAAVRSADLRGPLSEGSSQPQRLRAWQVYWIGGSLMTSDVRARLQLAINRLLGRGDDGAVIFLSTRLQEGRGEEADATLARFLGPNLAALTARLEAARSGP